jgi:hypothetical protein
MVMDSLHEARWVQAMIQTSRIDSDRAREIWREYQLTHDVSALAGQTAGIDPDSGEVFCGADAKDIVSGLLATGKHRPLFFVRIGSDHYIEKRGRR